MNKIYKHVTNAKNGQLVSAVAAETARNTGGSSTVDATSGLGAATATNWLHAAAGLGLKSLTAGILGMMGVLSYAAAPVGVVAHGQASLVTQGSVLHINQTSQAATVNFQQLNLAKGEGVAVQAQKTSDITLLRVASGMNVNGGFVTANNNLLISSPGGILVSNGGKISAQGEVYMTTQDMAVGQYNKPTAKASTGSLSISGQSVISGSNIVLDAGSVNLNQAKVIAAPATAADGIRVQGANVSIQSSHLSAPGGKIEVTADAQGSGINVQNSTLSAEGGKLVIGVDALGAYAAATTVQGSALSGHSVKLAGRVLNLDSTNSVAAAHTQIQTVDLLVSADMGKLLSSVLQAGSDVVLQGDNSVSMDRDATIAANTSHNTSLSIANTGSQQNNPNAPSSPTTPKPNQVAILGTINLNGGRKSLLVHSAGDLTLDGTRSDVSGDTTFQAIGTIVVNAAQLSTVGDLTIGRDAFGQGALSRQTVVFDSTLNGYNIETSGDTLTTQGVTARTTGGAWLLDPTDINISTGASTGGTLAGALAQSGTSTINTIDIQNAINAGTNVDVVATGTITVSNALTFSIASGLTGTLTLDNRGATTLATIGSYSGIGINVKASITNNGAGTVNLNFLSAGSINVNNSFDNVNKGSASGVNITSSSGTMNVTMQSFYNNTYGAIFGSNIYIYGNITTRGGFITLDGTGGTISQTTTAGSTAGETITSGNIPNGPVYLEWGSKLNTVSNASTTLTSATVGGNINIAASRDKSSNAGAFEQGIAAPIYAGGDFNLNTNTSGVVVFNYIVFNRETNSGIYTGGDINISAVNSSPNINPTNSGVLNITSPFFSYGGEINISSTSTVSGVVGINAINHISGYQGVNVVNNSIGQRGINTLAPATAVAAPGGRFTSTNGSVNISNTSTGAFTGIYLRGAVAGKDGVTILNNSESAATTSSGIYASAAISSSAGAVLLNSTTSTGTAITLTSAATLTAITGIDVIGSSSLASSLVNTYGAVSALGAMSNTGTGGVTVSSTGNTATGAITDSGVGGIDITGGFNIAAGNVTGGTITAVGALNNTGGGVISLSMAEPTSTAGVSGIEYAAGITTANATVASNVSYGNVGGVMGSVDAATVNTVNYRSIPTGSTTITLEVGNYSQEYGTSYSGSIANGWLSDTNNVTVSAVTGSSSGFGIVGGTPSNASVLSSLRFAGNLGGNSNLVQSLTNLSVLGAITSSYGTVNVTPVLGKNTYTITPKALTITGSTALSAYDGVRSYADVSAAGTSYVGLVSSIGGVLTGDAVTSLTRVITTAADTATPISGLAVVGSYVDTLSSAVGSGLSNYTITYAPGAFTVTPAALTITGGNRTTTYNATLQNNATYSVGGLLGADTVTSVAGVVASGTNAGTYNDSLSGALGTGLSNYTISYVNGALTINRAALSIASVAASSVYTAGAQTGTYTVTGLQGTVDAVTGVTGLASGTNAGTYTSTLGGATGTGLDNYNITYTNTAPFTITKANATLVGVLNNTAVYSGSAQTNTGAVFTGLLGDDATTISATGYAQATNVAQGTVTDNLSATGVDSGNYNFTVTNGSLRITPKALSVVGAQTTSVYNANTQTNTYTTTGLVGTDAIAVTGSASARNVSTTNDALGVAFTSGAASNYTTTITDGFLKITPATITLSGITAADKVYDGNTTASLSLGSVTTGGVLSTDSVTVNTGTLTGAFTDRNVGSQTVVISGISLSGADAANYQLSGGTTATTTAAITPKTLTVTGTSLTTTYNGGVQSLAAPVVTGLVTGDNVTIGGNASGTNAGAYNATYTAGGTDAGNYNLVSTAPATLTINKAALVVTANNSGKIVTQADPTLTAQLSGLQGSDTASGLNYTYTISRATGENAGAYAITPTGVASLTNYDVSYVPGQFTITPAGTVLIKMNPTTSTYGTVVGGTIASVEYVASSGGSLRTLTLKAGTTNVYTDGITGGGEITITPTTSVTSTTNAGTYVGAISNSNSDVSQSNGNFTGVQTIVNTAVVNQANLTLALAPVTKTYDGTAFAAVTGTSVSVTPTGLMNGQTLAGLGGLTYSGAAIGAINASASPYSLVGSVGSGFSNYNVTIAPSTVTINKAPLQITGGTNTFTFDNTTRTNTYAVTGGQLFASDSITGLTGRATRLHAGTTADTLSAATGTGLSNYDISYVNGGLTINPAQLLAVATPTSAPVYNGGTAVPNTTVLSGVIAGTLVSGTTSLALSGAGVGTQSIINNGTLLSGPNAGDYVVLSSNLANTGTNQVTPNLVSSGNGGGTVVITPAPLTITGGNASYVFNNTQRTNTYSVTSGTLYGSDSVTGVTGSGSGLRANTSVNLVYADNLSAATGTGLSNYAITYVNGGLTITPAPLTALATPLATTYSGGTSVANTTALTGVIAGTTVSGTTSLVMGSPNAGTQTITNNGTTLSGDFATDYYVVSSNLVGTTPNRVTPSLVATGNGGGTIVVAKAPLSIVGGVTQAVYDGTAQTNTATVTGAVNGELITTSGSAVARDVADGTVADVLVAVAGSGVNLSNYDIAISQGSLEITPATLTVSGITANAKQYNGTDTATLSVSSVSYNGVVTADIANVSVNTTSLQGLFADADAGVNKDVYVSGISITGSASSNYRLSGGSSLVVAGTITPAPLTITGGNASHVFNNTTRTNTYSVTSGTLYGTDSVTGVTGSGTGVHAGTHADNLSAATGNGISNYDVTYVNGALNITRAQLTALATPFATTYSGGTNVANTTALTGVIAGTDVSGLTSLVLGSPNAGLRNIINNGTTLSGPNGGDYEVVSSNLVGTTPNQVTPTLVSSGNGGGTIMVAKAPLTIAGATTQMMYNGTQQTNTATVTGAVNGELITTSGNAVARNVGDVVADSLQAVAGSGVDLNNYAITFTPGSLEITPAPFVAAPAAPSIEKPTDVFILPPTPPVFVAPLDRISDVLANLSGIRLSSANEPAGQPGACSADSAVLFGADSDVLTDEAKEKLRQCCAQNQTITLSGLRGAEGAGQFNIDLGKRRAQVVRKFIESACQMPQAGHPGKPQ